MIKINEKEYVFAPEYNVWEAMRYTERILADMSIEDRERLAT